MSACPTQLVSSGFLIVWLPMTFFTSLSKVTPWVILHHCSSEITDPSILVSGEHFCPSKPACSTTPSRSELLSDSPSGSLLSSQHFVLPSCPYLFGLDTAGPLSSNSISIIIQLLSFVLSDLSGQTPSISISPCLYLGTSVRRGEQK